MKRLLFIALVSSHLISVQAYAQRDLGVAPRISNDTLYTTSGYKTYKGHHLKIGTGTMPDGNFKYIRINSASMFRYSNKNGSAAGVNEANALPSNQSGMKYEVLKVQQRGSEKHGYNYFALIGSKMFKYEVDIENAIKSGEIVVPAKYRSTEPSATTGVADELIKLKKLLDDGVITQEEFDKQKKKLLN